MFKGTPFLQALPFGIMLVIGIQCIAFGVLSFFGTGFSGWMSAIINAAIIAFCLLFKARSGIDSRSSLKDDARSEHKLSSRRTLLESVGSKTDIAVSLFNLLFIVFLTLFHFGPALSLAFLSGDSASHCGQMIKYATGAPVSGQFVFGLTGAFLIDAVSDLLDPSSYTKCYVLNEMIWCWLSLQMFYTLISTLADRLNTGSRMVLCGLYAFGYPFYSATMGFGYYGASLAIACAIIFALASFSMKKPIELVALSVLLTELSVCYLLFVPPIFLAAVIYLLYASRITRKGVPQMIGVCLATFLVPCSFALFLNYSGIFFGGEVNSVSESISSLGSALVRDGGTLKILFADFIFLAPVSIYGFASQAMHRKEFMRIGLLPCIFFAYCIALFIACLLDVVSPYYFYKTYGVLWTIFFAFAAIGIQGLMGSSMKLLISYSAIWLSIAILAITGLDAKLSEKRPELDSTPISDQLFNLYAFNADTSRPLIFETESLSLLRTQEDGRIPEDQVAALLGENETRWFNTLGFEGRTVRWWDSQDHSLMLDSGEILRSLEDSRYVYIDDTFYNHPYPDSDYGPLEKTAKYIADHYDIAFETEHGILYQLNDRVGQE